MLHPERKVEKGTLRRVPRAAGGRFAWEWRFVNPDTGNQDSKYLKDNEFPTQAKAEEHLKPFIERLNSAKDEPVIVDPTVGDLLDRYIKEENLLEIVKRKPGERAPRKDELAFSTATSYMSLCNRIREAWGKTKLDRFKPLAFQNWLKNLDAKPKTKGHLKAFVNNHRFGNETDDVFDLADRGPHNLAEESLLVREVLVNGRLGNTGLRCHVVHARTVVTLLCKYFCCCQQSFAFAIRKVLCGSLRWISSRQHLISLSFRHLVTVGLLHPPQRVIESALML